MQRLKVLLLRPFSKSDELIPPFGLGYLATAIREKHDVEILGGIKEKLALDKFEKKLEKEKYDVVGMQVFTFQIPVAQNM